MQIQNVPIAFQACVAMYNFAVQEKENIPWDNVLQGSPDVSGPVQDANVDGRRLGNELRNWLVHYMTS